MFVPILNTSISASWLILAIIVVRFVFKKMPKALTCVLWGLVAIRLICPFSIESPLSVIPSAEIIPEEVLYMEGVQLHDPVEFNGIEVPTVQEVVGEAVGETVSQVQIFDVYGSLVWLAGMAIMLLYAFISYLRLRYRVMVSINERGNIWLCDQIDSPFILGMFRPRIYMPSGMAEEQAAYVIAHERAHLQRHDHWWKPFGFLLLSVYWFNPMIWVAYILLSRDIELACDEKVIQSMETPDKQAYSEALLVCSVNRRMIVACPLAFGEVGVKARVKSVLNYKKPAFWVVVGSVVICAVVAVCFLTDPEDRDTDETLETICEHVPGDFVSYEWREAPNPDSTEAQIKEQRWDRYVCAQCGEEFEIAGMYRNRQVNNFDIPEAAWVTLLDFLDACKNDPENASSFCHFETYDERDAFEKAIKLNRLLSYEVLDVITLSERLCAVKLHLTKEEKDIPERFYYVGKINERFWVMNNIGNVPASLQEDMTAEELDLLKQGILDDTALNPIEEAPDDVRVEKPEPQPDPERVEPVKHTQDILDLAVWTVSNALNRQYHELTPNTQAMEILQVEVDPAESARAAYSYFERKDDLAVTDAALASQMIAVKAVYHVDWFMETESNKADAGAHAAYYYIMPSPYVSGRWYIHDIVPTAVPEDLELPQMISPGSYTPIVLKSYGASDSDAATQLNAEVICTTSVPVLAAIYQRDGEDPAHYLVTKDGRAGELPLPGVDAAVDYVKVKGDNLDLNYSIYYYEVEVTEQVVDPDTGKVLAEAGKYRYFVDMVQFQYLTVFGPAN